jgi:DNA-binding Lrp family transcriptional regulator
LEKKDKDILNEIQSDFPITPRPYRELEKRLNLPELEILNRVKKLKTSGVIRRIGGNFHSDRLNYESTLCAAKVPKDKIEHFVEVVNRHPGVTHNYLRNHALYRKCLKRNIRGDSSRGNPEFACRQDVQNQG